MRIIEVFTYQENYTFLKHSFSERTFNLNKNNFLAVQAVNFGREKKRGFV
jgi:hypothetical protein